MAIDINATPQATTEKRTHFIDFTKDLPDGITVSSAVAGTVTFPTSGTAALAVGAIASNVVPLTVTNPAPAGEYVVSVTATLSDAETVVAYLHIPVSWKATRAGMEYLIAELRGMTDTGFDDFKVAGVPYWSDKHLQDALDKHRSDFIEENLYPVQQSRLGTAYYLDYKSQYGNLETVDSGTAIFKLDNAAGTNMPGTMWAADYQRGVVTFNADTLGSSMILTGRSYDLNAAAADVWRYKAANAAKMYSFSADGQSFQRNQFLQACLQMASYYEGQAAPTNISTFRGDVNPVGLEYHDEQLSD
jgi:hypothetical protein